MADITIAIIGEDKASAAIKSVNTSLGGLDSSAVNAAKSMAGIAAVGIGVAGAGIAAGLVAATKSAADFESQVSGIAAVAGPEGVAALDEIRAKALQVGKDTSFSASEAASGMEELIKAGVSIENVLGPATDATVALAAATGVDLATAAEISANAMNQFNIDGSAMASIADIVAGAANASAIDVNDFKFSLASVGAVANLAGIDFKDTAVAIAQMGEAGIKGSDAGTSLKSMFMNLIPSTKNAIAEFQRLGLITEDGANAFFDAEGKAKSMAEVQGVLADATKNMTEEQKLASLEIMFGSDGIRAAAVLAEQGAEGYDKMAASMDKISAADVAKTRLDNLNGSIDAMMGSLETAGIIIGTAFLPVLRQLVEGATELLNANMPLIEQFAHDLPGAVAAFSSTVGSAISSAVATIGTLLGLELADYGGTWDILSGIIARSMDLIGNFGPVIAGVAASFLFFTTVVGPILAVGSALAGMVTTFSAAAAGLSGAGAVIAGVVALLGGPVTVAILALVALVGVLTAAWVGNWGDIQGKTQAVVSFLSGVPGTIDGFCQAIATTLDDLSAGATETFNAMAAGIGAAVATAGEFFNQMGTDANTLLVTISDVWTAMANFIAATLTLIGTTISTAWNLYIELTMLPLRLLQAGVMAIWDALPVDIREDLELIGKTLVEKFASFITSALAWVADTNKAVADGWATITTTITGALNGLAKSIETWITDTLKALGGWAGEVGNQAQTAVRNLTDPVVKAFADLLEKLGTWAGSVIEALGKLAADVADQAHGIGEAILRPITDKLDQTLNAIADWAGSVINAMNRLLSDAAQTAGGIGQGIIDGIINTVRSGADALGDALGGVVRGALDSVKDALGLDDDTGEVTAIGRLIIDEIIIGARAKASDLSGALGGILKSATDALTPSLPGFEVSLPGDVTDWLNQAMSITGVSPSWLQGLLQLVQIESGGNPTAMNPEPVIVGGVNYGHATGLLQTIPPTFASYALPGHTNILNPVDNAIAAIRYIEATYGDVYEALRRHGGVGYATGGMISEQVWGVGKSGQVYSFGENGPEYVVPVTQSWSEVGTPAAEGINSRPTGPGINSRGATRTSSWSETDLGRLGRTIAAAIGQPVTINGYSSDDILRQIERQRRRQRLLYPESGWSG